ncbi:alpha/beta hydrolase [Lactococcus lactis]|uniref:alpha/beta hydrolase n=1 Tax=Lactococcus lactis TaxID=1358 RepID=UPI001293392D|nr:alpha/beta hydrolase [Lactococcus lactis]MQQ80530.1 alpha/beta hydrolase [Lactococcus lactis]
MSNEIKLTSNWDKVFPKSNKVSHNKVTFKNRFGIVIATDLYEPKIIKEKLPALAVSGPFGAVKEQASGLYAQEMAERGFLTLAFDPSYTGESGGEVRDVASPDINTEDFQAAVDFLWNHEKVDSNKIGIIGICGLGGLALNAAAIDTRIKATVVSTMYDLTRIAAKGYFDSVDEEQRYELKGNLNAQRNLDFQSNTYERAGGVVDPVPEDALDFVKAYHDYYKTKRGYHERSVNSNKGWAIISSLSYMNGKLLAYSSEIRSAVLVIHGENAHSRYFGEDAFKTLKGDNKKLMIIPEASHTDLYDQKDIIPFDELESFFNTYLEV